MKTSLLSRTSLVVTLLVLSITLCSTSSYARVLNVPDDYSTIQAAINAGRTRDIVSVSPGTYPENIRMKEWVSVIGADKDTTIIEGTIKGAANTVFENFTVIDDESGSPTLYRCYGCVNVRIRNNSFIATTNLSTYTGLYLSGISQSGYGRRTLSGSTSADIFNNSMKITSEGWRLYGINIASAQTGYGYNVSITNNNIALEGASNLVAGIIYREPTHDIKNNIITTDSSGHSITVYGIPSRIGELDVEYNLLVGDIYGDVNVLPSNIEDVSPVFVSEDQTLQIEDTSPAIEAAKPDELYKAGARDIGTIRGDAIIADGTFLQMKIDSALPGETVFIEPGYYALKDDLRIQKNIILQSRDSNPDTCILSLGEYVICIKDTSIKGWHNLQRRYVEANEYHYYNTRRITSVVLDGITITGYRESLAKEGYGPNQYISDAVRAIEDNGPIQNYGGYLTVKNCKIIDNHGIKVSGIYTIWLSSVSLENTLIAKNVNFDPGFLTEPWAAYGAWSGFTNHWTGESGYWKQCGVLYSNGRGFSLENCTLADNVNESLFDKVVYGATYLRNGDISIYDSILWNNGLDAHEQDYASRNPALRGTGGAHGTYSIKDSCIDNPYFVLPEAMVSIISEDPQFVDPANNDYTPQNPNCDGMGPSF